MNLLESFLDRIQSGRLDVPDIVKKSTKAFNKVYKNVLDDCFASQRRKDYFTIQPDIDCEDKAKLAAYKDVSLRLDKWINHCKDERCRQLVTYEKRKIEAHINYLEQRVVLNQRQNEV